VKTEEYFAAVIRLHFAGGDELQQIDAELAEDGVTVVLYGHLTGDETVIESFTPPESVDSEAFDHHAYSWRREDDEPARRCGAGRTCYEGWTEPGTSFVGRA